MKSKAKVIEEGELYGDWVEGYYFKAWSKHFILWGTVNGDPDQLEIDPKTLCQQVPNRQDLFVDDRVVHENYGEGIVEFNLVKYAYQVRVQEGEYEMMFSSISEDWKPTGKNIND